ncbi:MULTISPECIES: Qat anti-phage system ATPase QatA [Enterobacterales]|uniref:NTPase KAP n=1 Tax=Serratia marcescens TaxID=615 RepID=A0A1Q4NXE9_SERMA|nr:MULTISPECIES: Qat anti-phage system ATPase QatA [Enterobacterales]HBR0903145.1 NTPase KAP [Klebsiella pneumoniae]HEJ8533886.1 NTPase KAP [Klebsiella oxytoca]MCS6703899.1 P-loop NTPase fold protein [Klebsiella pneumoniae subsp. pneumoniae]MCX3396638.1 P-loop NTPase fold protein [Citrobacter amalonaticus]MDQ2176076.1 Qat anti-phage system ATPase QatA [Citrobacter amalonaticus]
MFLNDQETATDLLYYEAIARTVVKLIDHTPDAPITIGVHGDWGAGKSSVLKMLEASYEGKNKTLCLWFNGWTFEGFEDAKTVIIETLVEELMQARPGCIKVAAAAKKVLRRVDWLKMARKAGGLAFTAFTGIPTMDQLKSVYELASGILSNPQDNISVDDIKNFADRAGDFIKEADSDGETLPKHIHAFREEFKDLLNVAEVEKLVVIVDDLDRCLPKTAIETLEAIRLFLFVEKTAFVIGADEAMIEYAVREHFPDLPQSTGPLTYARNYLEKLIQVPFRIPALGSAETRVYTTLLLAENALGSKNKHFMKLLGKAREEMKRPWISSGLDRKVVLEALGEHIPEEIEQALKISAHVTPLLSKGTRGNPRQIKRFLNSMILRQSIAEERGFGEDIKRPVLAKIMLAERFYPAFYEQIVRQASSHKEGKPEALIQFEQLVRGAKSKQQQESNSPSKITVAEHSDINEWLKNDWAVGWAEIEPALANQDLRPYVFVTRDKQSTFGVSLTSSHLAPLVEKLLGSSMAVAGTKAVLEKLTASEVDEVFETLSEQILQEDSFGKKPAGIDGIQFLVKVLPQMQRKLLDFIRRIPVPKTGGVWLGSTFMQCFVDDTHEEEFRSILQGWVDQPDNSKLSSTAQAMLDLPRKKK